MAGKHVVGTYIFDAMSLIEPWLQLILLGTKTVEFRTWQRQRLVGKDLVLCSSKKMASRATCEAMVRYGWLGPRHLMDARENLGMARCVVRVKRIVPADEDLHFEQPGFNYHDDDKPTYAWELEDVRPIPPQPVMGRMGIYPVEVQL